MTTNSSHAKPPASDLTLAAEKLMQGAEQVLHEFAMPWVALRRVLCVGGRHESAQSWLARDADSFMWLAAPSEPTGLRAVAEAFDTVVCPGMAAPHMVNELRRLLSPDGLLVASTLRIGPVVQALIPTQKDWHTAWARRFEIIDEVGLFGDEVADPILLSQVPGMLTSSIFPLPDSDLIACVASREPRELLRHFFFDQHQIEVKRALALLVICRKSDSVDKSLGSDSL